MGRTRTKETKSSIHLKKMVMCRIVVLPIQPFAFFAVFVDFAVVVA